MKVIEFFAGTGSFSKVARSRGHETFTIDLDPSFGTDLTKDIRLLDREDIPDHFRRPDVLWSSPPCEICSVAAMGHHWGGGRRAYEPKTDKAKKMLLVYEDALHQMLYLEPRHIFIENPRGVMRKLPFMQEKALSALFGRPVVRRTVCYCRYGDTRMKPTDIWTDVLDWTPRPMCHNGNPDHEAAPRGARTGTQGLKGARERAVVPPALCEEVIAVVEGGLA